MAITSEGAATQRPEGSDVTIAFDNPDAARHFLSWLCEIGEQDYWNWMELREQEESEGAITAKRFIYPPSMRGIVIAPCGRLDRDE
ncbi:MAG TPA: hypothetical protein VD862_03130 [Candidatus Paceibacterota bacterium]|nr:hypothetical protein [Candidatus Paceibacterota bacterium]